MTERLTSDGLPVISEAVKAAFVEDLRKTSMGLANIGLPACFDLIENENPILADYANSVIAKYYKDNMNAAGDFLMGMFLCYELLRRQTGANKLECDLG